jgi:short-subunit dehydrogenase
MENNIFKNQVVLITGASTGVGRELAIQLASYGASLSLAARDAERLASVQEECQKRGSTTISIPTDIGIPEQCVELIQKTIDKFSRIDMLVCNAGLSMFCNFEDVKDIHLFEHIMKVNYLGSVYCTYYALPYLKQSKGRIVGISSLTGKNGVPTRTGYAASKHAMAGFFDSLRIELDGSGVSVTMIYPGFVATEMRERALGLDGKPIGKSHLDETGVMPVETCVRLIIEAAAKRKRELVMTLRGKLGLWMKLIAPKLVDNTARNAIIKGKT